MDKSKIELNKPYKYKELCEALSIEVKKNTRSKESQFKQLKRFFNIEKNKTWYTIKEIYEIPLEKVDGRKNNSKNFHAYPQFKVNKKYNSNIGVYSITLNNDIYIGSTTRGFRERFQHHVAKSNSKVTKEMLDNNATFQILWIANNETEPEIRDKENEFIQYYKNQDNWNVVNTRDAWSFTTPPVQKYKTKTIRIKVKEEDYEDALEFLRKNNLLEN